MDEEKVIAIKNIVNSHYNIDVSIRAKTDEYVKARAICYKILRDECYFSLKYIGLKFKRSHATVLHSLRAFPYMILQYPQMKKDFELILATWKGQADEYVELKPLQLKKELNDLREQNKMLNLSIINVQEELKNIKNNIKVQCQE
jgi:hypothetical protein